MDIHVFVRLFFLALLEVSAFGSSQAEQSDPDGPVESRAVTAVYTHRLDHLRLVTTRDSEGNVQTIRTTDFHPFFVEGTGWVDALYLQPGGQLMGLDGKPVTVVSTEYQLLSSSITVYNLAIEGDHTYFVEEAGDAVWVHNTGCFGGARNPLFEITRSTPSVLVSQARAEFNNVARGRFLREFAETAEAQAFFSDAELSRMLAGKNPDGWVVHHMRPLFRGGDNFYDNLILLPENWHDKNFFDLHFYSDGMNPFGRN